jgi:formylglycine-generating enzyme required for sulfatase activity
MAGNVREWVEEKGVVRGGSWYSFPVFLRVSDRSQYGGEDRDDNYGFRCARDGSP